MQKSMKQSISLFLPQKFFYCFCWGLRNLSALGQNRESVYGKSALQFSLPLLVWYILHSSLEICKLVYISIISFNQTVLVNTTTNFLLWNKLVTPYFPVEFCPFFLVTALFM